MTSHKVVPFQPQKKKHTVVPLGSNSSSHGSGGGPKGPEGPDELQEIKDRLGRLENSQVRLKRWVNGVGVTLFFSIVTAVVGILAIYIGQQNEIIRAKADHQIGLVEQQDAWLRSWRSELDRNVFDGLARLERKLDTLDERFREFEIDYYKLRDRQGNGANGGG